MLPRKWDAPGFQPPGLHHTPEGGVPTSLYLTGKVAVGIVMVSGSPWSQVPRGRLTWISAAQDGTVWGVNASANVYCWNGSDWAPMRGALTQISVGNADTVWGVNSSHEVFSWNGTDWAPQRGALSNVSAASDGSVWGVNAGGDAFHWNGKDWDKVRGELVQISAGSAESVWGVNAHGDVFRWNGRDDWTKIPGGLTNVSAAADGSVFGVNSAGDIFRYISSANTWQPMPGVLSVISAASEANIWAVDPSGNILRGDASSGLDFSDGQHTMMLLGVQAALDFLRGAEPLANLTFYYDLQQVTVSVTPGPDPSISEPFEAMEAPWRNAALVELHYEGSEAGSLAYVNAIKASKNADWAYVGYFTKYPLAGAAYRRDERTVMQYGDYINRIFAFLTCSMFGAANEIGSCGCGESGYFNIPNGNCVNCTSSQSSCLMNDATLELCGPTRGQLGWSSWNKQPGALAWVSTSKDGEVWGVNAGRDVFKWNGSDWEKKRGGLRQISVGNADTIWGVNDSAEGFRWNGGDWDNIPGLLTNVSAASDGTVWGVAGDIVRRWTGSSWTTMPGTLVQISVGNANTVWGVDGSGNVLSWNGTGWKTMPGGLTNVSVAADGTVWGVNSGGNIFHWTGSDWQQVSGGLVVVSAGGAKNIWGVNSGGDIYQRQVLATP